MVDKIARTAAAPSMDPTPGARAQGWEKAETGLIGKWHRDSGAIRPLTYFRVLHDGRSLFLRYDVMDTFVKSVRTAPNSAVCNDSCVEFFVQPTPGAAYFNFEINAGGTMLLYEIRDARRTATGFADYNPVPLEWARQVEIRTSLPGKTARPIVGPIAWTVVFRIPLALFAARLGSCSAVKGDVWRGNFFKCGGSDHWGMWSDVGAELNFHQPAKFGELVIG